jgi:hypothetical protein
MQLMLFSYNLTILMAILHYALLLKSLICENSIDVINEM